MVNWSKLIGVACEVRLTSPEIRHSFPQGRFKPQWPGQNAFTNSEQDLVGGVRENLVHANTCARAKRDMLAINTKHWPNDLSTFLRRCDAFPPDIAFWGHCIGTTVSQISCGNIHGVVTLSSGPFPHVGSKAPLQNDDLQIIFQEKETQKKTIKDGQGLFMRVKTQCLLYSVMQ